MFRYCLPKIKQFALQAQLLQSQHMNQTTLWCELGFLFHMIQQIESIYNANKNNEDIFNHIEKVVLFRLLFIFLLGCPTSQLSENFSILTGSCRFGII